MRRLTVRLAILWTLVLSAAAFARVHFRSITTGVAYDLGKLKTEEGKSVFLEQGYHIVIESVKPYLKGSISKATR
jgi:hypothetical protein